MIEEENASVQSNQVEEIAAAKVGGESLPKEASTVLGKFKDADALARAYESLQAEFTRRSQRLRSLEKEVENFRKQSSGAEKLRKTATARREEAKQFDAFVNEVCTPLAEEKPTMEQQPEMVVACQEAARPEEGNLQEAVEKEQGAPVKSEESKSSTRESAGEPSAEELFTKASENESVRLKIIGEYLSSLGKSSVPLTSGGVGVLTAPVQRAKTVGQAGDMALRYFRKPNLD